MGCKQKDASWLTAFASAYLRQIWPIVDSGARGVGKGHAEQSSTTSAYAGSFHWAMYPADHLPLLVESFPIPRFVRDQ